MIQVIYLSGGVKEQKNKQTNKQTTGATAVTNENSKTKRHTIQYIIYIQKEV